MFIDTLHNDVVVLSFHFFQKIIRLKEQSRHIRHKYLLIFHIACHFCQLPIDYTNSNVIIDYNIDTNEEFLYIILYYMGKFMTSKT